MTAISKMLRFQFRAAGATVGSVERMSKFGSFPWGCGFDTERIRQFTAAGTFPACAAGSYYDLLVTCLCWVHIEPQPRFWPSDQVFTEPKS